MTFWLTLSLWALALGIIFTLAWSRGARALGVVPPRVLGLAAPMLAVVAVVGYALLGNHPETAKWLNDWHSHRESARTMLEGRPDDAAANLPMPVLARVLQREVARTPTPGGWFGLALLYSEMEAPAVAEVAARKAVELAPGRIEPRLMLARSLIQKAGGQLVPEAASLLDGILAEQAGHESALVMLGMAAMQSGEYDRAMDAWDRLLARHGDDPAVAPVREARQKAAELKRTQQFYGGLTVQIDAGPGVEPGGTLFVFLRRAGEEGGQPLAAARVLADRFPLDVTLAAGDWLQSPPEPGTPLVAAARYAAAPGAALEGAERRSAPRPVAGAAGNLRASLTLE